MLKLKSIKIKEKDIKRIDSKKLKLHKTEPRWSIVERALDKLETKEAKT